MSAPGRAAHASDRVRSSDGLLLLVLLVAAVVYAQFGFDGLLARDDAIYIYAGQRLVDAGVPPYVSTFDHKGPLAPLLTTVGVLMARWVGVDDVLGTRVLFYMLSIATVGAVYALARDLFASRQVAVFAALVFVGFFGFARHAASGPQPKTPMVLCEVLALLETSRRRWFRAGEYGSLAFLVWQPMVVYPVVTLLLAAAAPRGQRTQAVVRALLGVSLPIIAMGAWFWWYGALAPLVDGVAVFNLTYLAQDVGGFVERLGVIAQSLMYGYGTSLLAILIGLVAVGQMYRWRWSRAGSLRVFAESDPFAPLLVSFPAPVIWSFLDFQWYQDAFVLLPYLALGCGWFFDRAVRAPGGDRDRSVAVWLCAGLVVLPMVVVRSRRDDEERLGAQRRAAAAIEAHIGATGRLVSIGTPEVLVLLHRVNPNPYTFVIRGIDRKIAAVTPGGIAGWLAQIAAYDPDAIAYGQTWGDHAGEIEDWLEKHYEEREIGPFVFYVRREARRP